MAATQPEHHQTSNIREDKPATTPWRRLLWLVALGLGIGMMHATKETCVIALLSMVVAAAVALWPIPRLMRDQRQLGQPAPNDAPWRRRSRTARKLMGILIVALSAAGVSALFCSSFLDNPRGVVDSLAAYSHYFGRASGEGSAGPHVHPWYYYLRLLCWYRCGDGPLWTEGSIALLALVGMAAAVCGKAAAPPDPATVRLLSLYAIVMTAVYSAIPYKTPWCALGLLHGWILLAGCGASILVALAPRRLTKAVTVLVLCMAPGHLTWQACRASFWADDDVGNPYVYAHTTRDVPRLAQRMEEIASVCSGGRDTYVQVIGPDDDYWPLPWYLRGFSRVGYFRTMPTGPAAPLIVAPARVEPELMQYLYVRQPPGHRHLYMVVGPTSEDRQWRLRPHVPLRLYVRREIWEAGNTSPTRQRGTQPTT